jgi:D-alanyl-D-alanine dipeptidase
MDPTLKLDIRYATSNNFLQRPVYRQARAFLQRPAAEALVRVNAALKEQGYALVVFDGYRPWAVTKTFWDATEKEKRQFVANPREGSKHNRGCAVDVSLFDLAAGKEVPMPSEYDEMSERASLDYAGGSDESRTMRNRLRRAMEAQGFEPYEPEWWHYNYKDWREYPILDIPFETLGTAR